MNSVVFPCYIDIHVRYYYRLVAFMCMYLLEVYTELSLELCGRIGPSVVDALRAIKVDALRAENSGGTGGGSACSGDKKRGVGSLSIHSIYQLHTNCMECRGICGRGVLEGVPRGRTY